MLPPLHLDDGGQTVHPFITLFRGGRGKDDPTVEFLRHFVSENTRSLWGVENRCIEKGVKENV